MNKNALKELGLLVAICLIAALLLAFVNQTTEGAIQANNTLAEETTRAKLLPEASSFSAVELAEGSGMDSCYEGLDESGSPLGYVIQTTVNGYGGEVEVTVGFDAQGVLTGINVGGANFSETAGLGAKAKEPAFTDQYIGKKVPLKVVKSNETKGEDTIDAISGATRTSAAVNGGVNLAGKYIADLAGGGSLNTASAQGFGGPVAVTLELDGDGAISSIVIGDDYFNETEGLGARALEESFSGQFVGKKPPLALSDIDAIAGATVTSAAVVDAVNAAYAQMSGAGSLNTASAQGFGGPVTVTLTLDGDGAISSIVIGDDYFNETEGLGARALEESFSGQFVGKKPPLALSDIDALSGATVTSAAVVDAVNAAYAQMTSGNAAKETETAATVDEKVAAPAASAQPAATEAPEKAAPSMVATAENTASVQGFGGPVAVSLELDETGAISAILIGDDKFAETAGLGARALEESFSGQFVGKKPPLALSDIDALSGATVTSTAVVDAVNTAYAQMTGGEAATENAATAEVKPVATAEAKPTEAKPAATAEAKSTEAKPAATVEAKSTEAKSTVAVATEAKSTEAKPAATVEAKPTEANPAATATTEAKPAAITASNPTVPTSTEAKATEAPTADTAEIAEALVEATASAQGFGGPVAVTLTLDADGAIASILIGDDKFAETAGLGARALEESFSAQFIDKKAPLALSDIDALSGATVTSAAVVDAVNAACAQLAPASYTATDVATLCDDGAWRVATQGFGGPVAVKLTLDGMTIKDIEIGDDRFNETDGLGKKALEPAFQTQFKGKTLPVAKGDIDALSGATVTTDAVLSAIDAIYQAANVQ